MGRLKRIALLAAMAVLCCCAGCGAKEPESRFTIVVENQSADAIGTLHYKYYLAGNGSGGNVDGQSKNYENMVYTPVKPGGAIELEISEPPPYDVKLKLPAQFTMDFFICEDQENCTGAEQAVEGGCNLQAAAGGVYTYVLAGSWDEGYTLTPAEGTVNEPRTPAPTSSAEPAAAVEISGVFTNADGDALALGMDSGDCAALLDAEFPDGWKIYLNEELAVTALDGKIAQIEYSGEDWSMDGIACGGSMAEVRARLGAPDLGSPVNPEAGEPIPCSYPTTDGGVLWLAYGKDDVIVSMAVLAIPVEACPQPLGTARYFSGTGDAHFDTFWLGNGEMTVRYRGGGPFLVTAMDGPSEKKLVEADGDCDQTLTGLVFRENPSLDIRAEGDWQIVVKCADGG